MIIKNIDNLKTKFNILSLQNVYFNKSFVQVNGFLR
jgi:hypothetical protein